MFAFAAMVAALATEGTSTAALDGAFIAFHTVCSDITELGEKSAVGYLALLSSHVFASQLY